MSRPRHSQEQRHAQRMLCGGGLPPKTMMLPGMGQVDTPVTSQPIQQSRREMSPAEMDAAKIVQQLPVPTRPTVPLPAQNPTPLPVPRAKQPDKHPRATLHTPTPEMQAMIDDAREHPVERLDMNSPDYIKQKQKEWEESPGQKEYAAIREVQHEEAVVKWNKYQEGAAEFWRKYKEEKDRKWDREHDKWSIFKDNMSRFGDKEAWEDIGNAMLMGIPLGLQVIGEFLPIPGVQQVASLAGSALMNVIPGAISATDVVQTFEKCLGASDEVLDWTAKGMDAASVARMVYNAPTKIEKAQSLLQGASSMLGGKIKHHPYRRKRAKVHTVTGRKNLAYQKYIACTRERELPTSAPMPGSASRAVRDGGV